MRARALVLSLFLVAIPCVAQLTTFNWQSLPPAGATVSGDFNRDGWPDLAVVDQSVDQTGNHSLYIYAGSGNGNFTLTQIYHDLAGISDVHTADLNGDGNLDLLLEERGSSSVTVMYGDGHGNFSAGTALAVPYISFLADLNGDGRVDVIADKIYLNQGGGKFKALPLGLRLAVSKVADVNRDGKLDLIGVTGTGSAQKIYIALGNGDGTFKTPIYSKIPAICDPSVCTDSFGGLVVADFYNDGNMHIAVQMWHIDVAWNPNPSDSTLLTFKNNGAGSFNLKHSVAITGGADFIEAADFNGDQFQDVLAYSTGARWGGSEIFYGNGTGSFRGSNDGIDPGVGDGVMVIRDLGLTGRQDVVAASTAYEGPFTILNLNTTTPIPGCPPPSAAKLSAKFCSPTSGAHSSSNSVLIKSSGNSPAGVQRMEIWIDGVKRGQRWADQIAETFTLSAGIHKVSLIAVDKYVGYSKNVITITVP